MGEDKKTLNDLMNEEIDKQEIHTGEDEDLGKVNQEYGGEDIQILKGLQPVIQFKKSETAVPAIRPAVLL